MANVRSLGYEAVGTQARERDPNLITFDLLRHRVQDVASATFIGSRSQPVIGVVCAAITQLDRCARDPEVSEKVNVERTIQLIEDLIALGIKPVYLSTSFVFDGSVGYYPEDYPHSPLSHYGKQKAAVERYVCRNIPDSLASDSVGQDRW